MARLSIDETTLTEIADSIRAKTGKSNSIMVSDMSDEIDGIATSTTPTISVSSGGLITATAGTKSATKQLTTQAAQTITPTTTNKTIASGRYLTGTQTIKGDANLKAENIKSGVSIFGVNGSHSGAEDLNAELTTQEGLISQLSTILDSKAAGGSGGSTGAVETCSVTLSMPSNCNLIYSQVENGEVCCKMFCFDTSETPTATITSTLLTQLGGCDLSKVVKGSFLICGRSTSGVISLNHSISGDIEFISTSGTENTQAGFTCGKLFKINGDCTITITK